jgi:predicted choloylglycine hydrolase
VKASLSTRIKQQLECLSLLCLMGVLFLAACSCNKILNPSTGITPPISTRAHWSAQPLTPDSSVIKIEVAGTHAEIGYLLGQWYYEQGHLPRELTDSEREVADTLLAFYQDVAPSMRQQLQGVYAAYNLNLDDASEGIPVWDEDGIRILLPGLVERHSCSVVAVRPEMTADGHARLGRNHDWPTRLTDVLLVFTLPEKGYPTVVMTRGFPGFTASDGMNGEGLALGLASVRNIGYESSTEPALVSTAVYRLVLEQSANVEEAIDMLRQLPIAFVNSSPDEVISHVLLADRSGASAVVEFLPEGIVVSRTDTPYQVMTNSHWAGPADQPNCQRYQTAVEELEGSDRAVDDDRMMEVMSSIQASTQWTVVYDLEELSLELTLPGSSFPHRYRLSLTDFVAQMNARE